MNVRALVVSTIKSKVIGGTIVYTLSSLTNKAISFLMLPVLTRYLTPADYGITAMFLVLLGLVRPFVGLMSDAAINRQFFEKKSIVFPHYISSCLVLLPISLILVSVAMAIFSGYIERWTFIPSRWLWSVIVTSGSLFITAIQLTVWQVEMKPWPYAITEIATLIVNVCISLMLIVGFGMAWQGRIIGMVVPCLGSGILCFLLLWRRGYINLHIRYDYIQHALKFSVPIIPHIFGMWAISMTDRLIIANMVSLDAAGIYAVGASIAMLLYFGIDSFNKAWIPWCFGELKKDAPGNKKRIVRLIYLFNIIIFFIAAIFGWLMPKILAFVVGKSFVDAGRYVMWLAIGFAFNGMYKMVCNFLFFSQATKWLPIATCGTAVLNLGLSIILVRRNGPVGAAQGTLFAYLCSFLVTWALSAKLYPMPWFNLRYDKDARKQT